MQALFTADDPRPSQGRLNVLPTSQKTLAPGRAHEELNRLHAEAFNTRVFEASEWNWEKLTARHSLGWVTARSDETLVGFVNVLWDGLVHAWIQDVMVSTSARRARVGVRLIETATDNARNAGCERLHVDFDDDLKPFYLEACGFESTNVGLIDLT